jgi:O-antigen/teichoic acid export membrane protein
MDAPVLVRLRLRGSAIAADAGASLASRVLGYGLSLGATVVAARALGADGKGLLSLGTALSGLVAVVVGLGLGTGVTIGVRQGWLAPRRALMLLVPYALLVAIAAVVVSAFSGPTVVPLPSTAYAVASAAAIGGLLLADSTGGLLQGMGAVASGMWVRQSVGLGQSVIAIVLVASGSRDVLGILVAFAAWAWCCALAGCVVAWTRSAGVLSTNGGWAARLIGVGLRTQAIWILLLLNYRLDMVLLGALGSVADVGTYSVAVGFSEVAWFGTNAIVAVLLPHLAGLDAETARARSARAFRYSVATTVVLSGVILIGLSAVAVVVFGPAFAVTPVAFEALIPGLIMLAGFKVLATFAIATGQTRAATMLTLIGVIVNVVANVALIPLLGSVGAAAASSISYSLVSVLAIVWFLRTSQFRLGELVPLPTRESAGVAR